MHHKSDEQVQQEIKEYKDRLSQYSHDYRLKHPDMVVARKKVFSAKRAGKVKPETCFCGDTDVGAHISDPTKPFEIVWLCRKCRYAVVRGLDI